MRFNHVLQPLHQCREVLLPFLLAIRLFKDDRKLRKALQHVLVGEVLLHDFAACGKQRGFRQLGALARHSSAGTSGWRQ